MTEEQAQNFLVRLLPLQTALEQMCDTAFLETGKRSRHLTQAKLYLASLRAEVAAHRNEMETWTPASRTAELDEELVNE